MEQQRDEHIDCADCGTSFLFSAGEAAVFAERGLASPKRCKECRRARKERGGHGDGQGANGGRSPRHPGQGRFDGGAQQPRFDAPRGYGGGRAFNGGPPRRPGGPVRYTGDVNEYRSPMADPSYGGGFAPQGRGFGPPGPPEARGPAPWRGGNNDHAPRGPRRPPQWRDDGNYRAPSTMHDGRGNGFAGDRGRPAPAGARHAGPSAAPDGPRRRREGEVFEITCNSCGVHAEVPFKPAEGRDVFCQACYRARKPA